MKKKCQFCEHEFVPKIDDYNIEIIDNGDLDIQLFCSSCHTLIEFAFAREDDFVLPE